jgi:Lsr2
VWRVSYESQRLPAAIVAHDPAQSDGRNSRGGSPGNPGRSDTFAVMATITRTFLVDDLDGSTDDVENVQISLDGAHFEIDLSAANVARLRDKLTKYLENGTRVTPRKTTQTRRSVKPAATSGRDQVQAVRDWARQNGYQVSNRGRISGTIQKAFDSAH